MNLLTQRGVDNRTKFLESPAAVIATLAASAVVCASLLTLTVTRVIPAIRLAGVDQVEPARVDIPQTSLGALPMTEAEPTDLAATDPAPRRAAPATLPQMRPDRQVALSDAATQPAAPAPTVIAGRPPVASIPRPDHIVALAAARQTQPDVTAIATARPAQRPATATATVEAPTEAIAEPVIEVADISPLATAVSPRPAARPADLDTTPSASFVTRAPDATENVVLASAPAAAPVAQPQTTFAPNFDRSANACSRRLAREIPRRPGNAQDGSVFAASLQNTSGTTRDAAVAREVLRGNVPDFLRDLAPVTFTGVLPNGRSAQITICVTPDYLAVGDDRDFMRVPLGLAAAGQIAESFNMMLPTTRMVDAIYAQADLRLSPSPMTPGAQMSSTSYFMQHNATVEQQRHNAGGRLGMLVSGHKKDLVLTNRLSSHPGRVAIYGWHRPGGNPIQPLSTVHGAEYADYSHGIRLVSRTAFVNGQAVDLRDLLMDGTYASLLNTEGPIGRPAIQIASR